MNNLSSRKLVASLIAILAIALNGKFGLGLTDQEIQSITNIAMAAICSQAGIDLAEKSILPGVMSWLQNRVQPQKQEQPPCVPSAASSPSA